MLNTANIKKYFSQAINRSFIDSLYLKAVKIAMFRKDILEKEEKTLASVGINNPQHISQIYYLIFSNASIKSRIATFWNIHEIPLGIGGYFVQHLGKTLTIPNVSKVLFNHLKDPKLIKLLLKYNTTLKYAAKPVVSPWDHLLNYLEPVSELLADVENGKTEGRRSVVGFAVSPYFKIRVIRDVLQKKLAGNTLWPISSIINSDNIQIYRQSDSVFKEVFVYLPREFTNSVEVSRVVCSQITKIKREIISEQRKHNQKDLEGLLLALSKLNKSVSFNNTNTNRKRINASLKKVGLPSYRHLSNFTKSVSGRSITNRKKRDKLIRKGFHYISPFSIDKLSRKAMSLSGTELQKAKRTLAMHQALLEKRKAWRDEQEKMEEFKAKIITELSIPEHTDLDMMIYRSLESFLHKNHNLDIDNCNNNEVLVTNFLKHIRNENDLGIKSN